MKKMKAALLSALAVPVLFQFGGCTEILRYAAEAAYLTASLDQIFGLVPGGPF